MVFVVTGAKGRGKSTLLETAGRALSLMGMDVAGFLSKSRIINGLHHGYDLLDVATQTRLPLASPLSLYPDAFANPVRHGALAFCRDALAKGNRLLLAAPGTATLFVDEVGRLELAGGGWAESLEHIRRHRQIAVISARKETLKTLFGHFGLAVDAIIDLDDTPLWSAGKRLADLISRETLTTHHPQHALFLGGRAILMQNGRIVADGPAKDVITPGAICALYQLDAAVIDALSLFGNHQP